MVSEKRVLQNFSQISQVLQSRFLGVPNIMQSLFLAKLFWGLYVWFQKISMYLPPLPPTEGQRKFRGGRGGLKTEVPEK